MKFFLYNIEYTLEGIPRFRFTNEITEKGRVAFYFTDWVSSPVFDTAMEDIMDNLHNTSQVLPPLRLPDNIIGFTIVSAPTQEAAGELVQKYIDAQVSLLKVCPNALRFITLPPLVNNT